MKTATLEPAAYFGRNDTGQLKAGNIADITLLNANPLKAIEAVSNVAATIKNGDVVPGAGVSERPIAP